MAKKKTPLKQIAQKPLEWVVPLETRSVFATNMVVQVGESGEYILSFFQVHKPVILGPPEVQEKAWEGVESVKTVCVASVTISHDKLEGFAKVMSDMVERSKLDD